MSRGRLLLVLTALAGLTLATGAHSALGAITVVQRPTTGGTYAYATPEAAPHVGARADVHYVTTGPDAPPLNDDDGNGHPDYVEEVRRAADAALDFYARYGFKTPGPDTGGPDMKPDIYIGTLPAGTFGLTFASAFAEGGTFVIVSPRLDPTEPHAFAGVRTTVAHELAHVIQFSYVGSGRLPIWAAEAVPSPSPCSSSRACRTWSPPNTSTPGSAPPGCRSTRSASAAATATGAPGGGSTCRG